jgi:hypothetical protein
MKANTPVTITFKDYPDTTKCGVKSRSYPNGYANFEEEIAGNLYAWLHQSYHVLWDVDPIRNEICIYGSTVKKLGNRFATLLQKDKTVSVQLCFQVVQLLSHIELNLQKKTNYPLLSKNQIEHWILSQAQAILKNHEGQIYLNQFIKMFGHKNEVDMIE